MRLPSRAAFFGLIPTFLSIHFQPAMGADLNGSSSSTMDARGAYSLQFEPFKRVESYKCGQFIENSINDPAMRLLYRANNAFIRWVSKPFPHEKLLNAAALNGDVRAWRQSLEENRDVWIEFEQGWIIAALGLIALTTLFTLAYLLYSCCVCFCCGTAGKGKSRLRSDKRWDNCKRLTLNFVITFFVVGNVFASVTLLVSTQYAQYGLEEMPTRLHYCTNDFSIYRSETEQRVRKLLVDDFHHLNRSLIHALDSVGAEMVAKIKRNTGAYQIDEVIDRAAKSSLVQQRFRQLQRDLKTAEELRLAMQRRLLKLQEFEPDLERCQQSNLAQPSRQIQCREALQMIQAVLANNQPSGIEQREMLPAEVLTQLQQIDQLDVEAQFAQAIEGMRLLEQEIQGIVNGRRGDAVGRLKAIDDTMFRLYEEVSNNIRSIDLKWLDEFNEPFMRHREQLRQYSQYGWIAFLVISGVLALVALNFLLGAFYGWCGRRPDYSNDDCCVKTTGGKFYRCGTWLAISLMAVLSVVTAVMMLVGANASNLICLPMGDPLARPDILSLLDRLAEEHHLESRFPGIQLREPIATIGEGQPLAPQSGFHLASLIRKCRHNTTLYTIFGMDQKFKLLNGGGPRDEYEELEANLNKLAMNIGDGHRIRSVNFYSAGMVETLQKLDEIHIPTLDDRDIYMVRQEAVDANLDPVITQLRKLLPPAASSANGNQPQEVVVQVLNFLEATRPDSQTVSTQLEEIAKRMELIKLELESMRFNTSELVSKLQHTNSLLSSQHLTERLEEAARQVAGDIVSLVHSYAQHVNYSMSVEISSCAPLVDIAKNTKAAVCDYALDPFNAAWLAMAVSLLFLVPLILLSTTLKRLYRSAYPFTKYTVSEPTNDATFATDVYEGGYSAYGHGYGVPERGGGYAALNGGALRMKPTSHYTMAGMRSNGHGGNNASGAHQIRPPAYR